MNGLESINYPMEKRIIADKPYTYKDFQPFFKGPVKIDLSRKSEKIIIKSQNYLARALESEKIIYGVNTGLGA